MTTFCSCVQPDDMPQTESSYMYTLIYKGQVKNHSCNLWQQVTGIRCSYRTAQIFLEAGKVLYTDALLWIPLLFL